MLGRESMHQILDLLYDMKDEFSEKYAQVEAFQHFQRAKKEGLLGIKALLEIAIEEGEKTAKKESKGNRSGGQKIVIEE